MPNPSLHSLKSGSRSPIKTYKIGITGNICSGKSRVRKFLTKMGLSTIDTSDIAFNIISNDPTLLRRLTQKYGNKVLDTYGKLCRRKLEEVTINSGFDKQLLHDIVSVKVRDEVKRFLYGPLGTYVRFVESPLLFETDSQHLYDEIWVIWVEPDVQLQRVMAQDGLTREQALININAEYPQSEKRERANRIIDNSGDWMKAEAQIREAYDEIKDKAFNKGL
jgi:dephospho-CoA kinase